MQDKLREKRDEKTKRLQARLSGLQLWAVVIGIFVVGVPFFDATRAFFIPRRDIHIIEMNSLRHVVFRNSGDTDIFVSRLVYENPVSRYPEHIDVMRVVPKNDVVVHRFKADFNQFESTAIGVSDRVWPKQVAPNFDSAATCIASMIIGNNSIQDIALATPQTLQRSVNLKMEYYAPSGVPGWYGRRAWHWLTAFAPGKDSEFNPAVPSSSTQKAMLIAYAKSKEGCRQLKQEHAQN